MKEAKEAADRTAGSAEKRCRAVEEDFEHFRSAQRRTPEAALLQQIAKLKGEMSLQEAKISEARAEKNQAMLEKEQYKAHIHRLARALQREKEKSLAKERREVRGGWL